jgi:opacity protein-like surface antigen
MVKRLALLFLSLAHVLLYGQEVPVEEGDLLSLGKTATLGVEASTAFGWDIENKSTGLETKAGLELVFPLFPTAHRGLYPSDFETPAVRLALRDASFTWLNVYQTRGGNYEQDNFNSWTARPLVLSFDTFSADLVWTNCFFRVASSTTIMRTDQATLFSIFDDVMDMNERWYYRRSSTRALWHTERYNIQQFPLLKQKIARDYVDEDYRGAISGILAAGAEFDKFSAVLKTASNQNGLENDDNAWLVGADFEFVPTENLKFSLTGVAGFNYEKTPIDKNPVNFGALAEYRLPLSDRYFLTPKIGFDFVTDTASEEPAVWELGAGLLFHTRGYNSLTSSRVLDWDDVIPIGASVSLNVNNDAGMNVMLSWFEPAGPDSMLPYFGGFLQLELANLLGANNSVYSLAFLAQLEYAIGGKATPYLRGGYKPEFQENDNTKITGNYMLAAVVGVYFTPVSFFSIDLRYETDTRLLDSGGTEMAKNYVGAVFTIRL